MNKKKVVILVLVIVLAAGAVGGGIFAFKKQKDKKTKVDVYPVSLMDIWALSPFSLTVTYIKELSLIHI